MIRIYHTSDLHDHRHIVAPLHQLRAQRPGLLVDCGDALRGSQTIYYRDEPIIEVMNESGYDVGALGNREFHYVFPALGVRLAGMRRPIVCANLSDTKGRALPFISSVERLGLDGERVVFFGLLVPQYAEGSGWERVFGWRFHDPFVIAAELAARTEPDVTLVALSHLGLRADRELALRVPRLDLILGGHSHDLTRQPELVSGVPIVHAGPYGAFASRTDLDVQGGRARMVDFALEPLR
jgi:2',3'-cyclic-nucleotide 2'-phosphodiesterase (5'-nucleotidase family)